jgi:hypothetical protein
MMTRENGLERLDRLVEAYRSIPMTSEEKELQRRCFAYGNVSLENERVAKEVIDLAAEDLRCSSEDDSP